MAIELRTIQAFTKSSSWTAGTRNTGSWLEDLVGKGKLVGLFVEVSNQSSASTPATGLTIDIVQQHSRQEGTAFEIRFKDGTLVALNGTAANGFINNVSGSGSARNFWPIADGLGSSVAIPLFGKWRVAVTATTASGNPSSLTVTVTAAVEIEA